MGRLDGKVAIVSGAARGQGEAEARLFVAEGAKVVLGDVLDDLGEKVAIDLGDAARYVHLDVTKPDDWKSAVDTAVSTFGKLDVLINNAGILKLGPIETQPLEEYLAVINVNQVGCFLGMQAVIPAMKAAGGGSIVNTSSVSGLIGTVGLAAYTASKFAVRGMTKVAAMELGHSGIRVNSVHPGGVDTAMLRMEEFDDIDDDAVYGAQPIPRVAQPEEIAKMMLFLASDDSSFSTGSEFVADGGYTAGPSLAHMDDLAQT
jgi:3alpha(or 20beta)-hydroxysteroid dehydrogenase